MSAWLQRFPRGIRADPAQSISAPGASPPQSRGKVGALPSSQNYDSRLICEQNFAKVRDIFDYYAENAEIEDWGGG
jgi:hypothetical protein